jgi:hypothetical protein
LYDILIEHVNNSISSDVNTAKFLSLDVLVAELSNKSDGVHTGILSKGVGDELKGLSVQADAVGVGAENCAGVYLKLLGNFHLNGGTTWDEGSLLNECTNDTEGIMERTVSFIEDELVRASQ